MIPSSNPCLWLPAAVNEVVLDYGHAHNEAVALLVAAEHVEREDLGRGGHVGEAVLAPDLEFPNE